MKKSFFPIVFFGVFLVFFLLFAAGCGTSAAQKDENGDYEIGATAPSGPTIWTMLSSGDNRIRSFFQGEYEVNSKDVDGKTPLHYAAQRRDSQLAGFFISIGADPNALDVFQESPLSISIENNDANTAAILVNAGANIHLEIKENTTAAALALSRESPVFKSMLNPATVETFDSNGRSVLHLACSAGNVLAVNDILAITSISPAAVNRKDNNNKNALDYALENPESKNHIQIAEKLILSGAVSDNAIFSFLAPAARSANYNIRRNEGLAAIHFAVMNNYTGLISFLIDKNVDINLKSVSGATALHEAARAGNVNVVKQLLDKGADVNASDAKGNTPLHVGIPAAVHKDIITLLFEKDANPNQRDEHGDTPLHIAIILNRPLDVIQTFLSGGSDVYIRNIQGKTPLYIAVQERREAIIPALLQYDSEVFAADNSGTTPFDIAARSSNEIFALLVTSETVNQRDSGGNTILHSAVRNRANPVQIAMILEQRALVDARNRDGDTALHIAVRLNQRESGEFLITRGANIFSVNSAGESPLYLALRAANQIRDWIINTVTIQAKDGLGNNMLHYAAGWNFAHAIPLILRSGISIEEANVTGETPLFMAIRTDNPSTIRVFLNNNANINARDTQGNSVLHAAVRWNSRNAAAFLIANGIDKNAQSLNGNTPLHDAIIHGMSDIETLLIQEKANLEARNIDGNTPFFEAVRTGSAASIQRLASNGADTSTRNSRGDTALHIAVGMERVEIINPLLRLGASIHARNTNNRTPFQISLNTSPRLVSALLTSNRINVSDDMGNSALHIAIQEKASIDIIRAILTQGARINAVDSNGKTPLRLALDMELLETAKFLADSGANPFLPGADNKTPAEIAFEKGEACVKTIFSGRAITFKDSSENTILHFAARYGTPQIINALIELGANKNARNISSELPHDIAVRWNKSENANLLR